MKLSIKMLLALALVMVICSCASADIPSITMLSTKTCPACAQMQKVMKEIDSKYSGQLSTAHIYLEDNPDIAKKYNVRYVPTLLFRDSSGSIIAQEIGYKDIDSVLAVFRQAGVNI